MAKATSFISELSLALMAIPQMLETIGHGKQNVLPIYFYQTREGGNLSQLCDPGANVKVVAVFPRRPKITTPGQSTISIKFNEVLFRWSVELHRVGIPTLAMAFRCSQLFDLRRDSEILWFNIAPAATSADVHTEIDLTDGSCRLDDRNAVDGPLPPSEVTRLAAKAASSSWRDVVGSLRHIRRELSDGRYGVFGAPFFYRPMFFLLW